MEKAGAKSKKETKDDKQKDQKIEEQVMKMLDEEAAGAAPEERFALLLRTHIESERGGRRLRQELKTQEKQLETVLREKENLQREYNKSVLMRDKLQEVCREQQKLIKSVKNESIQKIREEEERRKESQLKFQTSLNEITQSLTKNSEENLKLRDHNIEMTKKLKMLADQYHMREQQLEKLNEQVQLESQLHQAKLNKVQVETAMEKEILIKEKQIALEKFVQSQKMLKELTEREVQLKEQLNLYTAKYDDFQSSLQKSNDIFATYKAELDKMAKNTRKLEKETLEWKTKWEKSNAILIELATEKKERDDHAVRCNKQVEQLQKLLRALQSERTHLYKVFRDNNVECPPMPALPPEPEPIQTTAPATSGAADRDKMEMMTRNCAELKETLAHLQDQMKYLNVATGLSTDAPSKQQESQGKHQQQQQEDINKKRQRKNKKSKTNRNAKESSPIVADASNNSNSNSNNSVNRISNTSNTEQCETKAAVNVTGVDESLESKIHESSTEKTQLRKDKDVVPEPQPEPLKITSEPKPLHIALEAEPLKTDPEPEPQSLKPAQDHPRKAEIETVPEPEPEPEIEIVEREPESPTSLPEAKITSAYIPQPPGFIIELPNEDSMVGVNFIKRMQAENKSFEVEPDIWPPPQITTEGSVNPNYILTVGSSEKSDRCSNDKSAQPK